MAPRFQPTSIQTHALIAVGFLSVGYALYLRYMIIENVQVGLNCDTGLATWACLSRKVGLTLDEGGALGWAALAAAALTLLRPHVILFALTLAVTGMGLVLHNAGLAGLAAGLLALSLARPARAPGSPQAP
jgi:hypothetical protein